MKTLIEGLKEVMFGFDFNNIRFTISLQNFTFYKNKFYFSQNKPREKIPALTPDFLIRKIKKQA